jgi:gliding motility-associated-like protein
MRNHATTRLLVKVCLFFCMIFHASLAYAQPKNDNCEAPIVLRDVTEWCSKNGEFTNQAATLSSYDKATCFAEKANDVWFKFTAVALDVTITVRGAIPSANTGTLRFPEIALYSDDCGGTLRQFECATDASGSHVVQIYQGGLVPGAEYLIRIQARRLGVGTFQLCINNYNPPVQPGSDCIISSVLCDKSSFVVKKVASAGNDRSEANGSCLDNDPVLGAEMNSTWFTWTCDKSGPLTFNMSPSNPTDDLDFIIFELPNGVKDCRNKKIVRCMASGDNNYPSRCMGVTGLKDGETDDTEPPGCKLSSQSNFLKPLDMVKGKSYALMVNNFSATGNGFEMKFGGTGEFLGPKASFSLSDAKICYGESVTITDGSTFALGQIKSWKWFFGKDAAPATATGVGPHKITYNSPGRKTIALSVESSLGCITTQVDTNGVLVDTCCNALNKITLTQKLQNITCGNKNDGAIDLSVLTAAAPIKYKWTNSTATTEDLKDLKPGTYSVTVTNAATCKKNATFVLENPPKIKIDTLVKMPTCGGGQDGIITLKLSGGVAPFTYQLGNNAPTTNNVFPNLARGIYTFAIKDKNNCDTTVKVSLKELDLKLDSRIRTVTPPTCATTNDGIIQLNVVNGRAPFTFDWGAGFVADNVKKNLAAKTYLVKIKDSNSCEGEYEFKMVAPPPIFVKLDTVNISCFGLKDGKVGINPTGGVGAFTYIWSNGATETSQKNLAADTYTVTVSDKNGCKKDSSTTLIQPPALVLTPVVNNVLCYGDSTGILTLQPSGGNPPYTFSVGSGKFVPDLVFPKLPAKQYSVTMKDKKGCTTKATTTVAQPDKSSVAIAVDSVVVLGNSTKIATQPSANLSAISYKWTPETGLSCTTCPNPVVTPTQKTTYNLLVRDENGCKVNAQVTIYVQRNKIYFPNIFMPSGEQIANKNFKGFAGNGAKEIKTLKIFNRWGGLVYAGANISLAAETGGWDGTFKGKTLPPDTFAYVAEIEFIDGAVLVYKGDVVLMR